jgi:predicted acetyltransferase
MEVRLLKENEQIRAAEIAVISFHMRVENLESVENDWGQGTYRHWGAFDDDGTLMAHMLDHQYESWLDGTLVRNGGIGAVSTLPEYRTDGAVREIFRKLIPAAYADGEVISTLYPFSHAFYRKFGYETVCWKNVYEFSPAVLRGYVFGGKVRQWKTGDPVSDWTKLYNAFSSSFNLAISRDDARMGKHLEGVFYKDRKFGYMLWEDGKPAAYLIFQDIRHDPQAILEVQDLAWDGPAGFRAILGFLSRFSADYGTIRLFLPRNIELLSLIRSPLAYDIQKTTDQAYMIRVINAVKALEAIRKPEGCSFVIRISDEMIPENNGTWKVTAGGVSPTEEEPDLCVSERALGQLVCGAVSLAEAEYREDTAVQKNREMLEKVFIRKPILVEDHF